MIYIFDFARWKKFIAGLQNIGSTLCVSRVNPKILEGIPIFIVLTALPKQTANVSPRRRKE